MRLYGKIMERTGLKETFYPSRCSLLLGGGGYFQGVKEVREFSEDKITLLFKDGVLELSGSGFSIARYCDGDLELSGEIVGFSFFKNGKRE